MQIKLPSPGRHKTSLSGSLGQKMGTAIPHIVVRVSSLSLNKNPEWKSQHSVCEFVDWTTKSIETHYKVQLRRYKLNWQKGYDTELNINSSEGDTWRRNRERDGSWVGKSKWTMCSVNKRSVMPKKGVNKEREHKKKVSSDRAASSQKESGLTYITSASFCASSCSLPSILSSLVYLHPLICILHP